MPKFRARYLVQNNFHTAGDILLDAAAEKRDRKTWAFDDEMAAYLAETDGLRAAGQPLSGLKLQPPASTPYGLTATDEIGSALKGFGSFFTKLVLLILGAVGFLIVLMIVSWPA